MSVTSANASHPIKLKLIEGGILRPFQGDRFQPVRRQDFGYDVYKTNGAIYLARRDVLMQEGSFYGSCPRPFVMPAERSIDIDTKLDFDMAEFLYRRRQRSEEPRERTMNPLNPAITIAGRDIRQGGRPLLIAEVAQAHDGSLGFAHSFVDVVADAGFDAIKFQTHIAAAESTKDEPFRVPFSYEDASRFDYWRRMEFTPRTVARLGQTCDRAQPPVPELVLLD